ncbi:MAG: LysR family transcriptional regulator [Xanthobacteraceae bacterium]
MLNITPPTLTHQIKKLERLVGARLVERKGNTHVALTQAGLRLFERAARAAPGRGSQDRRAASAARRSRPHRHRLHDDGGMLGRVAEIACRFSPRQSGH